MSQENRQETKREHVEHQHRLTALLTEAAEQVPADVDLRPRLHARLRAAPIAAAPAAFRPGAPLARRPVWQQRRAVLAAGLLATLFVFSAFALARPLVLSWFGDSSLKAIALQYGTTIDRAATAQGVTLRLREGYADAARTVLTMRISASGATHPPGPWLPSLRLVDAQGRVSHAFAGSQFNNDALFEFLPLPSDTLGSLQSLTLVVGEMERMSDTPGSGPSLIAGPWQIAFQLQPQAGQVVALSVLPEEHAGARIQPERLDLTPAGVRLLVRVSGLPPDASLVSLTHFNSRDSDSDIVACPPGEHVCGSGGGDVTDGARMQLVGPDGQTLTPAWISVVSPPPRVDIPIAQQSIGPAGTAELQFLFFSPLHTTRGIAHVSFDQMRFASTSASASPEQIAPGPWTFDLPLG
jgi:hypothetical protein